MAKGRKPIPTAIKKLKGTARKSRTKEEPKKTALVGLPVTPKHWKKPEVDRFKRVCNMLLANKLLDAVNYELVYGYVEEMRSYFEAIDKILSDGAVMVTTSGDLKVNPWVRIRDMAFKNAMTISREFGFTPSSQTKIAIRGDDDDKEDDEFRDV